MKRPSGFWVICESCNLQRFWETALGKKLAEDPCPKCKGRCWKFRSKKGSELVGYDTVGRLTTV